MNSNSKKYFAFKINLALCLIAGISIFAFIVVKFPHDIALRMGIFPISLLLMSSISGFLLRVFRRKMFFLRQISFHQSFAYEAIVQTAQIVSPFFPRKAFEAEFLQNEGETSSERLISWLASRTSASIILAFSALSVVLYILLGMPWPLIGISLAMFFLAYSFSAWKGQTLKFLLMFIGGSLIWVIEGYLFCLAANACSIPTRDAVVIYILFTGLYEMSPCPFAIGVAELPVFISGFNCLPVLAVFHLLRIVPVLFFGWLYLSRYKFSVLDFLHPKLVEVLARRKKTGEDNSEKLSEIKKISVVIPAFNEEKRLAPFLKSVLEYAKTNKLISSVIIVDDGSTDKTIEVAEEIAKKESIIKIIPNCENRGKGFSVRKGVLSADADAILYADADGATPISEVETLLNALRSGADVAIGTRRSAKAERSGPRALIGRLFYGIVNILAVPGISDTQCGFKIFRRETASKVFSKSLEDGWAFDVEILYISQLLGYSIAELPVKWSEKEGSKLNLLRDALKMLVAVFRIRSRHGGFMKDA
ncbi:MAG TPA: glycosyltransferase family 2 protein [Victivallales bacterium]|nr:glycosyltransferase family 2 protein [Victivallales bacterium]